MIGEAGTGAGTVVPIVVATACSIVVIIGTARTWLRSYVDDRADARVAVALTPVSAAVTKLQIDVAVIQRQRRGNA